jgi:glycine reductase
MKAILYINQFFGQIGGEEFAGHEPEIREGIVGPGMAYAKALKDEVEITHTIICGDNFMGSKTDEAIKRILGFLDDKEFDIFFAGPAFRAGRYGAACGHICSAVQKKFGVPAITSMNEENPGVEMYRKEMYIFKGGASAAAMRKDVAKMSAFALRLLYGEKLNSAAEEGYFGRGIRDQIWLDPPVPATDRVIDMLLKKVNGEEYQSELIIPKSERAPIAPAIPPDRIQSASATKWGKYNVEEMDELKKGEFMTIHAGFDPAAANDDPNVVLPLDVMKEYAKEGKIGGVYPHFYATVGTGTTQAEATRMGQEIAQELVDDGVKAVILTST